MEIGYPTTLANQSQRATLDKIRRVLAASAISNPETAANASGVTATPGTADDATLTRQVSAKALFNSGLMAVTGGQFYYGDTSTRGAITSNNLSGDAGNLGGSLNPTVPTPPSNENMFGPSYYHFGTDAPKIQIRYNATAANRPVRLRVDGRYVDRTGYDANTNAWVTLDASGVRRPRTYSLETNESGLLFYIRVDTVSRLYDPTPNDPLRIVQYGDSHAEGANNGQSPALNRWLGNARIYADLIGAWDFRNAAVRSSGYVHSGSSGLLLPLSGTMDFSINQKTWDIVEFAAGYNDTGRTNAEVRTGALNAWRKARAAQPNALIVVYGVWGAATGPSAAVVATENNLKSVFAEWADPFAIFIPVSTAPDPWETTANSTIFVGQDGIHATQLGHDNRAYRRNAALRQAVAVL